MKISHQQLDSRCYRISLRNEQNQELARGYLYKIDNDPHQRSYGLMEDIFVKKEMRGQGRGTQVINYIINLAQDLNFYKLVAFSRHERDRAHKLYDKLGFKHHGKEFRMNL